MAKVSQWLVLFVLYPKTTVLAQEMTWHNFSCNTHLNGKYSERNIYAS
jgi:hypothetical protein